MQTTLAVGCAHAFPELFLLEERHRKWAGESRVARGPYPSEAAPDLRQEREDMPSHTSGREPDVRELSVSEKQPWLTVHNRD